MKETQNPLLRLLKRQATVILDGGLATELERRGHNIDDPLWSARLLIEAPDAIRQLHLDYLYAGADIVISASYQATLAGFAARGYSPDETAGLLRLSVDLALEARDVFWSRSENRRGRQKPLVAASIGPYGAYLANGGEYTGAYDLGLDELREWHRPRWEILAGTDADLLACETIPSWPEAQALGELLENTTGLWGWISFSCRNGAQISDGTFLADCAARLNGFSRIAAVGVNCTAPRYIPDLVRVLERVSHKAIVVYPNSGESYDPASRRWLGRTHPEEYGTAAREWRKLGAACIGGCCRTSPAHIRAISERLKRTAP